MGLWGRWRARLWPRAQGSEGGEEPLVPAPPVAADANVLAVSDLHLGHDLKHDLPLKDEVPALDLHLGALLDYYATRPEGGLPWRLVIAGDMVDFIAITLTPGPEETVPFEVTADERLYGLGPEPLKAVWKLGRVVERHRHLLERLARFCAQGHEVVIIRGNHDAEWGWGEVQEAFREALCDFAFPPAPRSAADHAEHEAGRQALRERMRFCPWFYLEPGRLYVEHGHLHDEFSISTDVLEPGVAQADGSRRTMREPVSTLALRYFGNLYSGLDLNEVERWGLKDFVRWGLQGGIFKRALTDYVTMCGRLIAVSARESWRAMKGSVSLLARWGKDIAQGGDEQRLQHVRRMLQSVVHEEERLAKELVALLRAPAERSVVQTLQMLYVDRLLLALLALFTTAGCAALSRPVVHRGGLALLVVVVAVLLDAVLQRVRYVDSHPKLRRAAARVSRLFAVPYVVMGHSHRLVAEEVAPGSRYFNLGSWLGSAHPSSDEPGFPHLVIGSAGAELRRWKASLAPAVAPSEVA